MQVLEPATEQVLAELPRAGVEDADEAIARAKAAFPAWRDVAPGDRAKLLRRLARVIEGEVEELAQLEAATSASRSRRARRGRERRRVFDYYAGAPEQDLRPDDPGLEAGLDLTLREPIGVVGLIVPWNFPLLMASWKVAPALAAGNTAILKPAELLPADRDPARRAGARGGHPGGRPQRRDRARRRRRRGDRRAPGRRQGRLHRRDDDRPGDHAARRPQVKKNVSLELGGKSPTSSSPTPTSRSLPPRRRTRLRQLRPGLLRAEPDPRRAIRPRAGRRALDGERHGAQGRRPARRRDRGRDARQRQAAREGRRLHRRRGACRRRRRGARRAGLLVSGRRSSTASRTTCASPARRSSARSSRSSRSTPRRRRSGSPTHAVRAVRLDLEPRHRQGAAERAGAPGRRHQRQLEQLGPHRGAVRRLQDVGDRARARDVRARPLHGDARTSSSRRADPASAAWGSKQCQSCHARLACTTLVRR